MCETNPVNLIINYFYLIKYIILKAIKDFIFLYFIFNAVYYLKKAKAKLFKCSLLLPKLNYDIKQSNLSLYTKNLVLMFVT